MPECPKCHCEVSEEALFCGNCAAPLSADVDNFLGKCIDGKYYIQEKIASGGMGDVYLARQKGVGQEVAIKKLKREYYQDRVIVERFINEARLYGRVTHPNAVKLHDLLNVNGQICIIMEYVHGKTLTQYVESGYVFSTRQIIDIGLQIADALATMHQAKIIHRDLKTENIMLMETVSGRFSVKILDFGIAKFKDGRSNAMTQEGVIVGTPEFMSPEQCYGTPVDHRADIYSFGILMYVIICGRLPFEASSALALLQKQVSEPLPELVRPDGSAVLSGLEGIVRKCAMKSPDERYQSFVEVISDLTCVQEGRETSLDLAAVDRGKEQVEGASADVHESESADKSEPVAGEKQKYAGQAGKDSGKNKRVETSDRAEKDGLAAHTGKDMRAEEARKAGIRGKWEPEGLAEGKNPEKQAAFEGKQAEAEDSEREIKFSLDDGELDIDDMDMSLGEDDLVVDEGESEPEGLGSFSENGEYSLGSILDDEFSEGEAEYGREYSEGGSKLWVVFLILVLIGGGGALYWGLHRGGETAGDEVSEIPESFKRDGGAVPMPEPEPVQEVAEQAPEPEVVPAAPAKAPVAASKLNAPGMAQKGVNRALMSEAEVKLNEGILDVSEQLLKAVKAPDGPEAERYDRLHAMSGQFQSVMERAKNMNSRDRCNDILDLLEELPDSAEGMRTNLKGMSAKCQKRLAAPPSMI
ncbi:MAG: protein kinase [Proteobacteria bacterium]|nr:protein kinase [Pseudomonadota bacterium]